jgi:hypothetical protein
MKIAERLGQLFSAQGLAGVVLGLAAGAHGRPAAAWVLVFLGVVLLTTGMLLWLMASEAQR